jgi:hypothetical protein
MKMKTHEFTIIATGHNRNAGDYEDRLYEAGCDDATISLQRGVIVIDFAREAATMTRAVISAIRDVQSAGVTIERIEPDYLVSVSDISERTGLSRQAISLYARGERGKDFPAPKAKVMSDHPLWDWYAVAHWLYGKDLVSRSEAVNARLLRDVNTALVAQYVDQRRLIKSLSMPR